MSLGYTTTCAHCNFGYKYFRADYMEGKEERELESRLRGQTFHPSIIDIATVVRSATGPGHGLLRLRFLRSFDAVLLDADTEALLNRGDKMNCGRLSPFGSVTPSW